MRHMQATSVSAGDVIEFWLGPAPADVQSVREFSARWYAVDAAFDGKIRRRFGAAIGCALSASLSSWEQTPAGALGLVILLDQFTRNAYRGTAEAFAGDAAARGVAGRAIGRGFDLHLSVPGRAFLYHPFEHSEQPADQQRSVMLFEVLAEQAPDEWREFAAPFLRYAQAHRDLIVQFGRFPHRNQALGRRSTAEELAWLEAGGGF